jgi:hypothetical protein
MTRDGKGQPRQGGPSKPDQQGQQPGQSAGQQTQRLSEKPGQKRLISRGPRQLDGVLVSNRSEVGIPQVGGRSSGMAAQISLVGVGPDPLNSPRDACENARV